MLTYLDDCPDDDLREARQEASAIRAAARRVCGVCGAMGGHNPGCPADPDEDDEG